jgi:hypothetical protein
MERNDMQMGLIHAVIVPPGTPENAEQFGPLRTNNPLRHFAFVRHVLFASALMLFAVTGLFGQTEESQATQHAGAGKVLVHSKFGGQIFGFDIDQNGTEGLLSESKTLADENILAAVETFDQKTGKILKVVDKLESQDDFVTMGIVGSSVGLVEREHVEGGFVVKRIFHTLNPLELNRFNGLWTPPIGSKHIIMPTGVSRNQGVAKVAVFDYSTGIQLRRGCKYVWACCQNHRLQQLWECSSADRIR